ncbi:MAG: RNA 2',3'-cyclic phosphodiesterase [Bacillota bacterium]
MRLFVACALSEEAREKVGEVIVSLSRSGADFRWVPPENLHLTLKFLGDVKAADVAAVTDAVRNAVHGKRPFRVTLGNVSVFPSPANPRVIWVGVTEGTEALRSLAGAVDSALSQLGFPREARPFTGHITIGRRRTHVEPGAMRDRLPLEVPGISSFVISSVEVMRSVLGPGAPTYSVISSAKLE